MRRFVLLALALACVARAAEPSATTSRVHLTARASEIDPRARPHPEINFVFADKAGKPQDVEHAMVDPKVAPLGKLVIWLMDYKAPLFERLTDYGLHAIQVHYANKWFDLIPGPVRDDGTSLGKIRLEATTGEDFSPLVAVPQPDGMKERAFQFVRWLARQHPAGKWEQFINAEGNGLRWDKVIISGASHGATSATRFAVHQRVDRVVAFCGPRDQYETWQGFTSATPANRIFGFTHVEDTGWSGDHYCRSWQMLGLHRYGAVTNVDSTLPPYGNSRRLTTSFDVKGDVKRAHSSVTPGSAAAQDPAGKYLHEAVWRYLFTHPVDAVGPAVAADPACGAKIGPPAQPKR